MRVQVENVVDAQGQVDELATALQYRGARKQRYVKTGYFRSATKLVKKL